MRFAKKNRMVGELLKWFNQVGDVLLTPCPSFFVEKFQTLLKAQVCSKATIMVSSQCCTMHKPIYN